MIHNKNQFQISWSGTARECPPQMYWNFPRARALSVGKCRSLALLGDDNNVKQHGSD